VSTVSLLFPGAPAVLFTRSGQTLDSSAGLAVWADRQSAASRNAMSCWCDANHQMMIVLFHVASKAHAAARASCVCRVHAVLMQASPPVRHLQLDAED